jgi:hypothetical protein
MTFLLAVLALSGQAGGASPTAPPPQTLTVVSFPATFTIACDPPRAIDDTRIDASKLTFTIAVDRGQPSPQSSTCSFRITIATAGLHHVDIVARYARPDGTIGTSTPAALDFTAKIATPAAAPTAPPADVRVPAPGNAAAPAEAQPPKAAPFTDPDGHKWTLAGTDVQMDGRHAPDAGPCTRLILASGKVYAFGLGSWWLWSASASPHWSDAGRIMPK